MVKKKQQQPKKTLKTYRPKFASRPTRNKEIQEDDGLLRKPGTMSRDLKVPTDDLPYQYKNAINSAYFFPPTIVVTVLFVILLVLGYLLF